MESSQDFKDLQDAIQKSLVSAVKTVNRISAEDLSFQRTVSPDVAEHLDTKISRLLRLSERLLQSSSKACGVKAPRLEEYEDVEMNWTKVVDVVDSVLEKADTALDEFTGLVNKREPATSDSLQAKKAKTPAKVIRNANVRKPQLDFEVQPDNFHTGPWQPILTDKPHANVSLQDSLVTFVNEWGSTQYKHPYDAEISSMKYPKRVYRHAEPIPSQPEGTTSAIWVDTYEGVLEMLEELKKAEEIAVDLEHHDFRTYTGLVSLMQISTRKKDWIVDTLRPWRHKLEILNKVFADPSIIKVFHGAFMDMVWLQRDLGLYVNGLFDTFHASQALVYPVKSLAYLLSKFVDFDADKQYQLADWRIRPLPEEMMYYARSDTHYLLYIYDCVRNELVKGSNRSKPETDLIGRVLDQSRERALSRYEHPDCDHKTGRGPRGWYNYLLKNSNLALNSEQFAVFRALWKWRDETARKEDESPNYVLGPSNLADVARANPQDAKALHSLLPVTAPLARARVTQIWAEIQRSLSENWPSLLHYFASRAPKSVQQSVVPKYFNATTRVGSPAASAANVSATPLPRSQLFGDMAISSQWDPTIRMPIGDDVSFPFPWERYIEDGAEVLEAIQLAELEAAKKPKPEPLPAVAPPPAEPQDEEFTLKRGRKRKAEAIQQDEPEQSGEEEEEEEKSNGDEQMQDDDAPGVIELDEDTAPQKPSKHAKRAAKKAKKLEKSQAKAERAAKRQEASRQEQEQEEGQENAAGRDGDGGKYQAVPFDYSKASTVLHAKRDANAVVPVVEGKKVFDPYSKSGDGEVKGARKMPPVRGEKSATFKR